MYHTPEREFRQPRYVYKRASALPRAFLVARAVTPPQGSSELDALCTLNPREACVVEDKPVDGSAEFQELPVTRYAPGDITLQCTTAKPSVAVFSQAWHPDWKITDNGHPLELRRVNYGFIGFALPAGEHSLRIWYRPWDFYGAGLISTPLWAIALGTGAWWLVRRKHPRTV